MAQIGSPRIFDQNRRLAVRRRMLAEQQRPGAPRYLIDDMVEDVLDRIAFVRIEPRRALIIGDFTGALALALRNCGVEVDSAEPAHGFDEEQPYPKAEFDFIASLGTLDTVNDLPGALIHLRKALAPGGLAIASFVGGGSLPLLRGAMLAADGERPAARLHPQVDVRAGAQLLRRAGFADPVADGRSVRVRFGSLHRLVADLRAQGLSSSLRQAGPRLGKAALDAANSEFVAAEANGGAVELFEIVTLTGWRR